MAGRLICQIMSAQTRVWWLIIAAVACTATGPLHAAPRSSADRANLGGTVLWFGAEDITDAEQRAVSLVRLVAPDAGSLGPSIPLEEFRPDSGLFVAGTSWRVCEDAPIAAASYRQAIDELYRDNLAVLDAQELIQRAQALEDKRLCLAEPVEPGVLARVPFLRGVIEDSEGHTDRAVEAFHQVLALDPHHPWDPEFPPSAEQLYLEVRAGLARRAKAELTVVVSSGSTVWLDGAPLAAGTIHIAPGGHLIQLRRPGAEDLEVMALDLEVGEWARVIDPAILRGPSDPNGDLDPQLGGALSGLAVLELVAPQVWLVGLGDRPRVWSWQQGQFDVVEIPVPDAVATWSQPGTDRQRLPPGPVTVGMWIAGAVLTGVGVAVADRSKRGLGEFNAQVVSRELEPFPMPDDEDPEAYPLYQEWQTQVRRLYSGYGLLLAGGATFLLSIPVGLADERRRFLLGARVHYEAPGSKASRAEDWSWVLTWDGRF